jgi:hypothetical protein
MTDGPLLTTSAAYANGKGLDHLPSAAGFAD